MALMAVTHLFLFLYFDHCHVKLTMCNHLTNHLLLQGEALCFSYISFAIDVFLLLLAKGDVFISCRLLFTAEQSKIVRDPKRAISVNVWVSFHNFSDRKDHLHRQKVPP